MLRLLLLRLLLPLLACDSHASNSRRVHQRRLTSGRGETLLLRPYRVYYLLPLLFLLLCRRNAMIYLVETGPFFRGHGSSSGPRRPSSFIVHDASHQNEALAVQPILNSHRLHRFPSLLVHKRFPEVEITLTSSGANSTSFMSIRKGLPCAIAVWPVAVAALDRQTTHDSVLIRYWAHAGPLHRRTGSRCCSAPPWKHEALILLSSHPASTGHVG